MENSYIKIYRGLTDWEWYKDSKMVHLFIHLLLKANFVDGRYKGIKVKRGQVLTGRKSLAESTGISEQSIRTCIKRLISTTEITTETTTDSTNGYSLITIVKYDQYQEYTKNSTTDSTTKSTSKSTKHQPGINQASTTIEEEEEINKKKNITKFENLKFEIINSDRWIEDNARIGKITTGQVKTYLATFLDELLLKDDFHKEIHEYKKYFVNWLKINKPKIDSNSNLKSKTSYRKFIHK